ncbi:MAG: hypothetical protein C4548_09695 [Desulfobacteraceae bacterium]|jgi:hypothetical protein|nr:MAG: hypothetical protein C4548_09695 [Desulfobacteraceae bacterium]
MPNTVYLKSVIQASVYPAAWRVLAAILVVVSRGSLPVIAGLLAIETETPVTEPILVRLILVFAVLPGLAAALIRHAFAFHVKSHGGNLIFFRPGWQITLDLSVITAIIPWRIPLPGPGLSMNTVEGGRPRKYLLQTDHPQGLLNAMGQIGETLPAVAAHPSMVYAQARYAAGIARWYHILGKFGIFSLIPAVIFSRLHQYIVYGEAFGQYHFEGLTAYLSTFGFYWIMMAVYMLLYASIWRVLAEGFSLAVAKIVPVHAFTLRRWTERVVMIFYYGGIPVLVGLRFLV